jgi:hypothetical protein
MPDPRFHGGGFPPRKEHGITSLLRVRHILLPFACKRLKQVQAAIRGMLNAVRPFLLYIFFSPFSRVGYRESWGW